MDYDKSRLWRQQNLRFYVALPRVWAQSRRSTRSHCTGNKTYVPIPSIGQSGFLYFLVPLFLFVYLSVLFFSGPPSARHAAHLKSGFGPRPKRPAGRTKNYRYTDSSAVSIHTEHQVLKIPRQHLQQYYSWYCLNSVSFIRQNGEKFLIFYNCIHGRPFRSGPRHTHKNLPTWYVYIFQVFFSSMFGLDYYVRP